MPKPLPERASLDWLRKTAKQNLRKLKRDHPDAKLADAQLALAREYGFPSWRTLKAQVEQAQAATIEEAEIAAFLLAVGDGDIELVRAALAARPGLVNAVGPHPYWGGRPQPLHVAIEARRRDLFDLLLEAGADVSGRNEEYDLWSPLMLTFSRDREDMRRTLLEHGARIGLVEAMLTKDDDAVADLTRGGREALPPAPNRGSLLAFARTPFAIDRLLALGVPADLPDRWGTTPIEAMSRLGPAGSELVRHMISRDIPAAPQDYARLGDRERLEQLAAADPALPRSDAVMVGAVDFGHHGMVRWLLDRGGPVNARSDAESRHTALHSAAWNGDLDMVRLLVEAGADLHALDAQHGGTPLDWAETAVTITNNEKCAEVADYLRGL